MHTFVELFVVVLLLQSLLFALACKEPMTDASEVDAVSAEAADEADSDSRAMVWDDFAVVYGAIVTFIACQRMELALHGALNGSYFGFVIASSICIDMLVSSADPTR
jgi:hypothetical protein